MERMHGFKCICGERTFLTMDLNKSPSLNSTGGYPLPGSKANLT